MRHARAQLERPVLFLTPAINARARDHDALAVHGGERARFGGRGAHDARKLVRRAPEVERGVVMRELCRPGHPGFILRLATQLSPQIARQLPLEERGAEGGEPRRERAGILVTKTLVFAGEGAASFAIAGTLHGGGPMFRAFDKRTGEVVAELRGSQAHDEIEPGRRRTTNRAGGIEGGISNGEEIVVRAAMKPLPTLMKPLASVDLDTGEPANALVERSDVAAVEALAVVAEAAVAFELARAARDKFGGDALGDFVGAWRAYRERIGR